MSQVTHPLCSQRKIVYKPSPFDPTSTKLSSPSCSRHSQHLRKKKTNPRIPSSMWPTICLSITHRTSKLANKKYDASSYYGYYKWAN